MQFVAIYSGESVPTVQLVATSATPSVIRATAQAILEGDPIPNDPILAEKFRGQLHALHQLIEEGD